MELSLKIALPGGRVERIKADFPYEGSPVGFRVLVEGKTGLVVGVSDDGQVKEVVFPDKVPLTSEKNLSALKDTAMLYGLIPWRLLWELLPSEWNWKKERFLKVSLSSFRGFGPKDWAVFRLGGKKQKGEGGNSQEKVWTAVCDAFIGKGLFESGGRLVCGKCGGGAFQP
jgi:hypothetical protein